MLKKIFHYLQLKPDHINAQDILQRLSASASEQLQRTASGSVLSSYTRHLEAQGLAFSIVIWLLNSFYKDPHLKKKKNCSINIWHLSQGLVVISLCGHDPLCVSWWNLPFTTHIHMGSFIGTLLIPQEKQTLQEVWLAVDKCCFHQLGPASLNKVAKSKHHILISKNWTNAPEF